jgi:hypothetical protein
MLQWHCGMMAPATHGVTNDILCTATGRFVAKYLMLASHAVLIGTLVLIWLLIPAQFDIAQPLALQVGRVDTAHAGPSS